MKAVLEGHIRVYDNDNRLIARYPFKDMEQANLTIGDMYIYNYEVDKDTYIQGHIQHSHCFYPQETLDKLNSIPN